MSSGPARVDSFEAIKRFRAVLIRLAGLIDKGTAEAEAEIQSTDIWLKQDQTAYWKAQVRKREAKVHEAKLALKRAQLQKGPLAGRQSFVDERKALAQAERALEEARDKQVKVKSWIVRLEQEYFNYKGQAKGASQAVDSDIPRAVATLDRMLDSLEDYTRVAPPADERVEGMAAGESDMRRPEEMPEEAADESHDNDERGTGT